MKKTICILVVALFLSGCVSQHYEETQTGELKGKLILQWLDPDEFRFLFDKDDPLTFKRSNGQIIQPNFMNTDGGSIPRPLWIFKSLSPWGYAPAFIIHDWLFHMKYCNISGYEKYDVFIAGQVMSEVIKTMMNNNQKLEGNKFLLYSMYVAVTSDRAKKHWSRGKCDRNDGVVSMFAFSPYSDKKPKEKAKPEDSTEPKVLMEYTFEF